VSRRLFWLLPLALLPVPLLLNPYQQYVLNTALLYVPVGIGFNLVVGNLGLLAFSNVAYFGLGAYTSGVMMVQLGMPWWLTVIPAALVGGIGGAIASIPALRGVRLFYLAIMTLAFGELMRWTYIRWEALTGGSMGMAVPTATLFGWALDTDRRRFLGFNQSSQRSCALTVSACQMPLQVFSSQGFCEASC
jgi:branched-chain amino acid transport system permease protein